MNLMSWPGVFFFLLIVRKNYNKFMTCIKIFPLKTKKNILLLIRDSKKR